jgi:hypothetical protein
MTGRGQLTPAIKAKMDAFLKWDTGRTELHLIPYLQYVMVNDQRLDPNKISRSERDILSKLREHGHIEGGASELTVTPEFWDFMCDILWDAYVAYEAAPSTSEKAETNV